ncbi:hypothetical protein D3C86_1348100 [compost metagenome]
MQLRLPAHVIAREFVDEDDGGTLSGFFHVEAQAVVGMDAGHMTQEAEGGRGPRRLNQSAIWLPVMKSTFGWPSSRSSISSK